MGYKSPLRKLVVFFEQSRDNWKRKYQASKEEIKSLKNKLYYREQQYQAVLSKNQELEAEIAGLKEGDSGESLKKN